MKYFFLLLPLIGVSAGLSTLHNQARDLHQTGPRLERRKGTDTPSPDRGTSTTNNQGPGVSHSIEFPRRNPSSHYNPSPVPGLTAMTGSPPQNTDVDPLHIWSLSPSRSLIPSRQLLTHSPMVSLRGFPNNLHPSPPDDRLPLGSPRTSPPRRPRSPS